MSGPFEIFLKLDGIPGESTVKGHEKETVVLSYEQGVDATILSAGGAGGGGSVSKATFTGVRFRKPLDKGSIPILLTCAQGKHIKTARFTFRRSGTQFDFYKVELDDVLVTHVAQRAGTEAQYPLSFDTLTSGADASGFLDEITLRYARIRWTYVTVNPNGTAAPPVVGGWDTVANKKI